MKIEIPLIFWHGNRDRIMSIDFYPNSNFLVTCGAEAEDKMWIKLWDIEEQENSEVPSINTEVNPFKTGNKNPFLNVEKDKEASMTVEDVANSTNQTKIKPKFMYDISGAHTATVNIVRFSPNGMYLASGGDDSAIVIWVQKSRPVEFGSTLEKITWSNHKILRGHLSDIYDISWSPDSKFLISGSVDNSAIIFNMEKGKGIQKMSDHSHFVQGVSWDPRNKYVTTQSSDKSVRIYKNADVKQEVKFYFANQIKRFNKENVAGQGSSNFPPVKENYAEDKMIVDKEPSKNGKKETGIIQYYFADEIQCPSFVRRHNWSPDGSILILVAGILKSENAEIENVVWGFSRKDMTKPCFLLPTLDRSATCIRFCPILFEKDTPEQKGNTNPELIDLPYKMIFAIGTLDSLFIYDTQDICPKYAITNIHYQPITDIAWKGSSILAASSSDGYITFCTFEKDELGRPADPNKLPEKCRESYMNYLNIDSSKNVIPIHNVTNIVKNIKKKPQKVESQNAANNENLSSENSNNKLNNNGQNNSNENSMILEDAMAVDDDLNINSNNFTSNQINLENSKIENNSNININNSSTITILPNNPSGQKRRINPTMLN